MADVICDDESVTKTAKRAKVTKLYKKLHFELNIEEFKKQICHAVHADDVGCIDALIECFTPDEPDPNEEETPNYLLANHFIELARSDAQSKATSKHLLQHAVKFLQQDSGAEDSEAEDELLQLVDPSDEDDNNFLDACIELVCPEGKEVNEDLSCDGWKVLAHLLLLRNRIDSQGLPGVLLTKLNDQEWMSDRKNRNVMVDALQLSTKLPSRRMFDLLLAACNGANSRLKLQPPSHSIHKIQGTNPSILAEEIQSANDGSDVIFRKLSEWMRIKPHDKIKRQTSVFWTLAPLYHNNGQPGRELFNRVKEYDKFTAQRLPEVEKQYKQMTELLTETVDNKDLGWLVGQYLWQLEDKFVANPTT